MSSTEQPFDNFKTAMCRDPLNCKWGDDCGYAHTIAELRKTKMCRYIGRCTNKQCTFAHDPSELVGSDTSSAKPAVSDLRKTKMCRYVGRCTNKQCTFAHHPSELVVLKKYKPVVKAEPKKTVEKAVSKTAWAEKVRSAKQDLFDSDSESEDDVFDPATLGYDEAWKLYTKYMKDHDLDDNSWGDRSVIDTPWDDWRDNLAIHIPVSV